METGIVVVGLIGLVALAKTFVNLLQYAAAALRHEQSWGAFITMVTVLLAGIGAVALYSTSILAHTVPIPGTKFTLADVDFGAVVILGIAVGSIASTVVDYIAARDDTDSAKKPNLVK